MNLGDQYMYLNELRDQYMYLNELRDQYMYLNLFEYLYVLAAVRSEQFAAE